MSTTIYLGLMLKTDTHTHIQTRKCDFLECGDLKKYNTSKSVF